jgi:hypothetical protein
LLHFLAIKVVHGLDLDPSLCPGLEKLREMKRVGFVCPLKTNCSEGMGRGLTIQTGPLIDLLISPTPYQHHLSSESLQKVCRLVEGAKARVYSSYYIVAICVNWNNG